MRTVHYEPAAYSLKHDKRRSFRLYREWAEGAWQQELQACVGESPSADYGMGFRDGFVDYVYLGGTGEPPPIPPRRYWNASMRSPEGHAGAQEWFDGYRRGAQAARDGGYRQMATLRSSLMRADAQHSGMDAEIYAPVEPDYKEGGPFEDDLPLPDSAIQTETKVSPGHGQAESVSGSPANGAPAEVDASRVEDRLQDKLPNQESTSVPAASEGLPEGLNSPPAGSSEAPPEMLQEPGMRIVTPPLEKIIPPAQNLPDAEPLKTEKQESSSSPSRGEAVIAAAIEPTTPRLVLVQHVQLERMAQVPAKSPTNGLRFKNQVDSSSHKADDAPNERLSWPKPASPAVGSPLTSRESMESTIRLVGKSQEEPVGSDTSGNRITNSIRLMPAAKINAPAVRMVEQTSKGFTR